MFFHSQKNKGTNVSEEMVESMDVNSSSDESINKDKEQKKGTSNDGGELDSDEKNTSSSSTSEDKSADEEANEANL